MWIDSDAKIRKRALLAGLSPGEKFLFTVVILFILGLGFQLMGAFIAAWIYGFSINDILSLESFDDPDYVAASKLIQILGSVGTFIIPAFLFSFLFTGDIFSYYRFSSRAGGGGILLVIAMMVSIIPFINYLAELNMNIEVSSSRIDRILRALENEAEQIMRAFTATRSIGGLLVNLLMIGIIASVGEELIFRGLVQRLLGELLRNPHVAIMVTAVFFSAFHFQFFSFIPRFVLGVILGYLMYLGGSIWFPIMAHFVNNTMGVIYYYFNSRGSSDDMLEEIGTSAMMPMAAVISLFLFAFFFILWVYQLRTGTGVYPSSGTRR
ncbi:MAG: CPBP family intramembrane metalloprotease [Bacteroidetes bacterium]|nr:MAG: CPBP family intramembrane metalloprotease [Bacteroidota bacterium]